MKKETKQENKQTKNKSAKTSTQPKVCFDNELYLKLQSENINKRIKKFHNKLYLEFGGKIFDDLHAARVLPGFDPNIKIKLLQKMKDKAEIIFCISSNDIEKNKIRADLGLSYDNEVLRLVDNMRELGLYISALSSHSTKDNLVPQNLPKSLNNVAKESSSITIQRVIQTKSKQSFLTKVMVQTHL